MLVSSIVNDLIQAKTERTAIAFVYCDWQQYQAHTVANILGSLVRQIVEAQTQMPALLQRVFGDHGDGRFSSLTEREQLNLLNDILLVQERCFIVIDGLDECNRESTGSLGNRMTRLEAGVTQLLSNQQLFGRKNLAVMISSRFAPRLESSNRAFQQLQLEAEAHDISSFLRHEFTSIESSFLWTNPSLVNVFIDDPIKLQDVVRVAAEQSCSK